MYPTPSETEHRLSIFHENYIQMIEEQKRVSHQVGITKFFDLTPQEFLKKYTGAFSTGNSLYKTNYLLSKPRKNPTSIDHRPLLVEVKNQQSCGSCWSFSTTCTLEFAYNKLKSLSKDTLVNLSESQLVDCAFPYGSQGCSGSWVDSAMYYVQDNGQELTSEYGAYVPKEQECTYNDKKLTIQKKTVTFVNVPQNDPVALENAAVDHVVSVIIDSSKLSSYTGGVITESPGLEMNHAVSLVGYGHDDKQGVDYWLVRNSWGTDFGEKGYFRVLKDLSVKGFGVMAINRKAIYPILNQ